MAALAADLGVRRTSGALSDHGIGGTTGMIGVEVTLKGRLLSKAGQEDGNVFVWLDLFGWRLADGTRAPSSLRVTAIKDFVNLEWQGATALKPGDEVLIRVVEPIQADEPERKPREDADAEAAQERLTYEWLKRKYEAR